MVGLLDLASEEQRSQSQWGKCLIQSECFIIHHLSRTLFWIRSARSACESDGRFYARPRSTGSVERPTKDPPYNTQAISILYSPSPKCFLNPIEECEPPLPRTLSYSNTLHHTLALRATLGNAKFAQRPLPPISLQHSSPPTSISSSITIQRLQSFHHHLSHFHNTTLQSCQALREITLQSSPYFHPLALRFPLRNRSSSVPPHTSLHNLSKLCLSLEQHDHL